MATQHDIDISHGERIAKLEERVKSLEDLLNAKNGTISRLLWGILGAVSCFFIEHFYRIFK